MRSNVHTHTTYSDGRDTAERMIERALELGFVSLGFSDHGYDRYGGAAMTKAQERAYIAEIRELKARYAGRIEIALGVEHDACEPDYDLSEYEFVIESVHWLERGGESVPMDYSRERLQEGIDRMYGGDPYALCRDYFRTVNESMLATRCDIVGHIGLMCKFNDRGEMFDTTDARYVQPALETFRLAAEKGLLVEINTGAIARGYRTAPYPEPHLLKSLREMGGRILFGSDCHNSAYLDCAYTETMELARSAGFREYWLWKDGGFCARPL